MGKIITREQLIAELVRRGYKAEANDVNKNSIVKKGISIRISTNIAPIFYIDDFMAFESVEDAADSLILLLESSTKTPLNVESIMSYDNVVSNLFIGLMRKHTTDYLYRDVSGMPEIIQFMYIRGQFENAVYTIKVSLALLNEIGLPLSTAWEIAEKNTFAETKLVSLFDVIPEMNNMFSNDYLYVLTNTSAHLGASAILNKRVLKNFCDEKTTNKLVAIPCSIHEFIIVPFYEGDDFDMYSSMVPEVNSQAVNPEDQLGDHAYLIELQ